MVALRGCLALLCVIAPGSVRTALSSPLTPQDQVTHGEWEEAMRVAAGLDQQGKYDEAAAMMSTALKTAERLGLRDARLAIALNNMASVWQDSGRYAESEKLYRRALRILDEDPAADPALVVTTVNNMALLYADTGRYAASEKLLRRYRPVAERLSADAPESWAFMTNLATADLARRRFSAAEAAYKQVLAALERNGGPDPAVASLLTNLGVLCAAKERYTEALSYMERSLALCRRSFGEGHPETVRPLLRISRVYAEAGQLAEGERFVKEALGIAVRGLGPEHPVTGLVLSNYAFVLRRSGRKAEGKKLDKRAEAVREKAARENPTHHTIDISDLLSIPGRR